MPDLHTPPVSILDQIKNNLRDRYDTGYPILKELLQNADDAEAGKFRLDGLPGWFSAAFRRVRQSAMSAVADLVPSRLRSRRHISCIWIASASVTRMRRRSSPSHARQRLVQLPGIPVRRIRQNGRLESLDRSGPQRQRPHL
jgi:hypothetical protein